MKLLSPFSTNTNQVIQLLVISFFCSCSRSVSFAPMQSTDSKRTSSKGKTDQNAEVSNPNVLSNEAANSGDTSTSIDSNGNTQTKGAVSLEKNHLVITSGTTLKYIVGTPGSSFRSESITYPADESSIASIDLDSNGHPFIAYHTYQGNAGSVNITNRTSDKWSNPVTAYSGIQIPSANSMGLILGQIPASYSFFNVLYPRFYSTAARRFNLAQSIFEPESVLDQAVTTMPDEAHSIAYDRATGYAHAVWFHRTSMSTNSGIVAEYSHQSAESSSWSASTSFGTSNDCGGSEVRAPGLAIEPDTKHTVHVFFSCTNGAIFHKWQVLGNYGTSWAATEAVANDADPFALSWDRFISEVDSAGIIHLVYFDKNRNLIYRKKLPVLGWSDAVILSPAAAGLRSANRPQMVLNDAGLARVYWVDALGTHLNYRYELSTGILSPLQVAEGLQFNDGRLGTNVRVNRGS